MDDYRLVRDLLDANITLTTQVVELARLVIGALSVSAAERAPIEHDPEPDFELSSADDWPDIPEQPLPSSRASFESRPTLELVPDPVVERDIELPLAMTEEEEDLRFSVGMGHEPPQALAEMLERMKAPSIDIQIVPVVPDA